MANPKVTAATRQGDPEKKPAPAAGFDGSVNTFSRAGDFFVGFCAMKGLYQSDIARIIGFTQPTVAYHIKTAEFSLLEIEKVMDALGYAVRYDILREGDEPLSDEEAKYVMGSRSKFLSQYRLDFLRLAIARYGYRREEVAEKIGAGYSNMRRWFATDDCSINRVAAAAHAMEAELWVEIRRKEPLRIPSQAGSPVHLCLFDDGFVPAPSAKKKG